jgi:glycosyltransferase involved in cell wall biosynthesis
MESTLTRSRQSASVAIAQKPLKVLMMGASLDQNGGIATLEKLMLHHAPDNVQVQHVTTHDEGSMLHRIAVFTKAWLSLLRQGLLQKVDLVHIHLSNGGSVLRKALLVLTAKALKLPVLVHANGAEFHTTYESLPRWLQALVTATFSACQSFVVVTNLWRDYYVEQVGLSPSRVHVLANPTKLPEQVPDRQGSKFVQFVFCGRVGDRKGTFDLIQAVAQLPAEVRQTLKLIIAGDGEVERAQQMVEQLGLQETVQLLGWVDAAQRDCLLQQSDVFVLPSYNEGLPLALMEAMGWGLPVLTTPVSGIPDIVSTEQNGLLVPAGAVPELSMAIARLVQSEALRLRLGKAARQTMAAYDIHPFYEQMLQIYSTM